MTDTKIVVSAIHIDSIMYIHTYIYTHPNAVKCTDIAISSTNYTTQSVHTPLMSTEQYSVAILKIVSHFLMLATTPNTTFSSGTRGLSTRRWLPSTKEVLACYARRKWRQRRTRKGGSGDKDQEREE